MLRRAPARLVRCCLLAACAVLLAGCDRLFGDEDYFPPPETMGGWRANLSPEFVRSRGLDPAALEDLGRFSQSIRNSAWPGYDYHHHTATIVIKDGWIVGEWYSLPESRFFQQYLASNGKSFAYLLFGVLVKESRERQARVQFTEQSRVYDPTYLQEGFPLSDPRKAEITFEQIFRHTAGFLPEESKDGDKLEEGRNFWSDYSLWVTGRDPKWPLTGRLFSPGPPGGVRRQRDLGRAPGGLQQHRLRPPRPGVPPRLRPLALGCALGPYFGAHRLLRDLLPPPAAGHAPLGDPRRTVHDPARLRPLRLPHPPQGPLAGPADRRPGMDRAHPDRALVPEHACQRGRLFRQRPARRHGAHVWLRRQFRLHPALARPDRGPLRPHGQSESPNSSRPSSWPGWPKSSNPARRTRTAERAAFPPAPASLLRPAPPAGRAPL